MRSFPGDPGDLVDDEVACNVSPGAINPDGLLIAGERAQSVIYRFYKSKLYRIDIAVPDVSFPLVNQAFREKYGEPAKVLSHSYQNGFGAHWDAAILAWQSSGQGILLLEGPGNGPGQNPKNSLSVISFADQALQPPSAPKSRVDF